MDALRGISGGQAQIQMFLKSSLVSGAWPAALSSDQLYRSGCFKNARLKNYSLLIKTDMLRWWTITNSF